MDKKKAAARQQAQMRQMMRVIEDMLWDAVERSEAVEPEGAKHRVDSTVEHIAETVKLYAERYAELIKSGALDSEALWEGKPQMRVEKAYLGYSPTTTEEL